jgi:hypothetical protein
MARRPSGQATGQVAAPKSQCASGGLVMRTLTQCEAVIERGLESYAEVGTALTEIRDRRLYRATHETFEAYLHERWSMSRPRAYQLIEAAATVGVLSTNVDTPRSEAVVRELAPLRNDPAAMSRVMQQATEQAQQRISQLIQAADLAQTLSRSTTTVVVPNERVARELAPLRNQPEAMARVITSTATAYFDTKLGAFTVQLGGREGNSAGPEVNCRRPANLPRLVNGGNAQMWTDNGALWRPEGEANPASYGSMPAYAKLRRRRSRIELPEPSVGPPREEVFVDGPAAPERRPPALRRRYVARTFVDAPPATSRDEGRPRPQRLYAGRTIASMNLAQTTRYYAAKGCGRSSARSPVGGVLAPGAFYASCACGARLSLGELSAVTTPCPISV